MSVACEPADYTHRDMELDVEEIVIKIPPIDAQRAL